MKRALSGIKKLASKKRASPIYGALDNYPAIDGKPNWLRVALYNGQTVEAYNHDLPAVPGLPVVLDKLRGSSRYEIVGPRDVYDGDASYPYIKRHGSAHNYFSSDPTYIETRQIRPLGVTADGLTLTVASGVLQTADGGLINYTGETVDLTTYTVTGSANWLMLTIDTAGALHIVQGGAASPTEFIPSEIPPITAGEYPLAAVRLILGSLVLRESAENDRSDIIDLRLGASWGSSAAPSASPVFQVAPKAGLTVTMRAGRFAGLNQFYDLLDTDLDMTPYMPTAGNEAWAMLYIDSAGGFTARVGTEKPLGTSTIADAPTPLAYRAPLALIKLADGMTAITAADILDARQVNISGATALRDSPIEQASFVDGNGLRFDFASGEWKTTLPSGSSFPTTGLVDGLLFTLILTGRQHLMMYSSGAWMPIMSFGTTTFYVDPAVGTNTQTSGTAAAPFQTIQYAWNQIPGMVGGNVTINLAAGTYTENVLQLFGKTFTGQYTITIAGSATRTVADSGTFSAYINGSGATYNSATDATKSWTVDAWRGYFCRIGTGAVHPIDSNTATSLGFVGNFNVNLTGQTYEIYRPSSVYDKLSYALVRYAQQGVIFDNIYFTGATTYGVQAREYSAVTVQNCIFEQAATGTGVFVTSTSYANMTATNCIFRSATSTFGAAQGLDTSLMTLTGCYGYQSGAAMTGTGVGATGSCVVTGGTTMRNFQTGVKALGGDYINFYSASTTTYTRLISCYYGVYCDKYTELLSLSILQFTACTTNLKTPLLFPEPATGRVGINNSAPTSTLDVYGSVEIVSTGAYYFGDPTTDGSWRLIRVGNNLDVQRREAGVWVDKQVFIP